MVEMQENMDPNEQQQMTGDGSIPAEDQQI